MFHSVLIFVYLPHHFFNIIGKRGSFWLTLLDYCYSSPRVISSVWAFTRAENPPAVVRASTSVVASDDANDSDNNRKPAPTHGAFSLALTHCVGILHDQVKIISTEPVLVHHVPNSFFYLETNHWRSCRMRAATRWR